MTNAIELVQPLLEALGDGFLPATAPDGTAVLSTPFRFFNGDTVEIAFWEDADGLRLSDRGGLTQSLLLKGWEVLEAGPERSRLRALLDNQGVELHGGTVVAPAAKDSLGADLQRLLQALLDGQVAVRESAAGRSVREPTVYNTVRQTLEMGGARYRENMRVTGALGRRYPVDFELAFKTEEIIRAVLVIATDRTLEMAERWNFRFRDIRRARPALHRLFLVSDDAPWTRDAYRTIAEAVEAVFGPGETEALAAYLKEAKRLA